MEKYFIRTSSKVGSDTLVIFIPATTINCTPPYVSGKRDSCWVYVTSVDQNDKEQSENAIGMSLLPID